MGDGMRGRQGSRGMFTRIPGNVLILAFRGMFEKIPGNIIKDSGECSRRSQEKIWKIPGSVLEDSRECSRGFRGMFGKIPVNLNFDLFLEILLVFNQILLLICCKTMKHNNYWAILLKKAFSSQRLTTSLLSLITIFLT